MSQEIPNDVTVCLHLAFDFKGLRALRVLIELYDDLAEDFAYRDDVKRGLRATKYLLKNARLSTSQSDVRLFEVDSL